MQSPLPCTRFSGAWLRHITTNLQNEVSFDSILTLGQTALELGLISSLTVLALFLSYSMLNVCDLSTDGCFTLGAVVGASVALSGH